MCLLASFPSNAQSYNVELTNLSFRVIDGVKNNTTSHLLIELVMADNSKRQLYFRHLGESGDNENDWWLNPPMTVSQLPVAVRSSGFVNFRSGTDADYDQTNGISICNVNGISVPSGTPRMTSITFNVKFTPILSLSSNSTLLPDNDKITLNATAGFPSNVYNWEYSLNGWEWDPFPASTNSAGKASVDVSLTDLLQPGQVKIIGENTYIRMRTCTDLYSNVITLNNRLSSPKITGLAVNPNKCFGESNGSVKIQFDRELYTNELLNIFLEDTTSATGYNHSIINLTSLDPGNTITWPSELPPGGYRITLLGKYPNSSIATYTDGPFHVGRFGFTGPTAMNFNSTKRDAYCNGGTDGTITINTTGGVGNYLAGYRKVQNDTYTWTSFASAGTHTITGLDTGTYYLRIRDGNDCMMKDARGKEVIATITIGQPAEPLHVDNYQAINPLAFGYTDGSIRAILTGGTPVNGDSYNLQWTNEAGAQLTPEPPSTNPFTSILQNIGDGKYILQATDAHYALSSGANAEGCITRDTFTLVEPEPLLVEISEYRYVSCKNLSDGELYAKAQGGIELPVFRYKYQWLRNENGTWTDISQSDSIAIRLIAGLYKIIITDRNNISKESDPFLLTEPDLLTLDLSSTPLVCNGSNNGSASALINGGTLPYSLEWTTGETSQSISNLAQGTYMAFVKDAHGCQVQQLVKVTSPDPVSLSNLVVKDATCYKGNDGAISFTATGGSFPYNYNWNNGQNTSSLNGLSAGEYRLTLTDSKGCPLEQIFTVNEPPQLTTSLKEKITLCAEQVYEADASIQDGVIYSWTANNGFYASEAKVRLNLAGEYYVSATTSNGCVVKDTVGVTQSNAVVAAEMLASSQAFANEEVMLVNISKPAPEKVEWVLPDNGTSIISANDQYAQVKFRNTGHFTIGMKTMVGACEKLVTQSITIVQPEAFNDPGPANSPFIKEFMVAPNPSGGQFTVKISLEEKASIKLRLIDLNTGATVHHQQKSGEKQYQVPCQLSVNPGVYSLVLETAKEYRIIKVMIL